MSGDTVAGRFPVPAAYGDRVPDVTVDLDAIRARLAAATPGPWAEAPGGVYGAVINPAGTTKCGGCMCDDVRTPTCTTAYGGELIAESIQGANRKLIAHAPADLAALCDAVDRARELACLLEERLDRCEKAALACYQALGADEEDEAEAAAALGAYARYLQEVAQ